MCCDLTNFGVISDFRFLWNLKMATLKNSRDVPSSVMEMLEIFLAASSRGEHSTLILESRMKKLTTKYRCVEKVAGSPAPMTNLNLKRRRRGRIHPGNGDPSWGWKHSWKEKLLLGARSRETGPSTEAADCAAGKPASTCWCFSREAVGIPQLDGIIENVVEVQPEVEEKVTFTFISNYGEEDVLDSLEELKEAKSVPDSTQLVSRYRTKPLSADHLCVVVMNLPVGQAHFTWPELPGYPDFFQDVQRV